MTKKGRITFSNIDPLIPEMEKQIWLNFEEQLKAKSTIYQVLQKLKEIKKLGVTVPGKGRSLLFYNAQARMAMEGIELIKTRHNIKTLPRPARGKK